MTPAERRAMRKTANAASKKKGAGRLGNALFGDWMARGIFAAPGQPLHSRLNYGKRFDELTFRAKVAAMRHFGSEAAARKAVDEAAERVARAVGPGAAASPA